LRAEAKGGNKMNLSDLLRASADRHPEKVALRYGAQAPEATLTFAEFDRASDRVATILAASGISPGDRVALGMHNLPHFAYAYFGILRAGAVAVPLNALSTQNEVRAVLEDSKARALFTAPPFEEKAAPAARDAGLEVYGEQDWAEAGKEADRFDPVPREEQDLAVLAYTSGTTSAPKGAMLTHGNLIANLDQQMAIPEARVTSSDVVLLSLPLFHIYGLNVTLGLLVMNAATGILVEQFDPVSVLRACQEHEVSVMFGAPPMYLALVSTPGADQYDLSSVRFAISGAAPLEEETLRAFRDMFGIDIFEGYGLTETAPVLTTTLMGTDPRPRSVGKPLPEVELKLVDEHGHEVERGDPGEVVVRGPNVFQGYWDRPDLTGEVFLEGGWFKTGDIGVEDEDGYLYLVDRKRDLIIVSGFNVFPAEVEDALKEDPRIAEAAVVGVPHRHTGEAVKAYVVLADGASADSSTLRNGVAERLARFKVPETIEIVDALPTSLTGKVVRRALRTSDAQEDQV
jgi:long-chain acyl-CoA synthetase